jgi:hypothetical protein
VVVVGNVLFGALQIQPEIIKTPQDGSKCTSLGFLSCPHQWRLSLNAIPARMVSCYHRPPTKVRYLLRDAFISASFLWPVPTEVTTFQLAVP